MKTIEPTTPQDIRVMVVEELTGLCLSGNITHRQRTALKKVVDTMKHGIVAKIEEITHVDDLLKSTVARMNIVTPIAHPIETAPKDGTYVILLTKGRIWMTGYYSKGASGWIAYNQFSVNATHWLPLPDVKEDRNDD